MSAVLEESQESLTRYISMVPLCSLISRKSRNHPMLSESIQLRTVAMLRYQLAWQLVAALVPLDAKSELYRTHVTEMLQAAANWEEEQALQATDNGQNEGARHKKTTK